MTRNWTALWSHCDRLRSGPVSGLFQSLQLDLQTLIKREKKNNIKALQMFLRLITGLNILLIDLQISLLMLSNRVVSSINNLESAFSDPSLNFSRYFNIVFSPLTKSLLSVYVFLLAEYY